MKIDTFWRIAHVPVAFLVYQPEIDISNLYSYSYASKTWKKPNGSFSHAQT